MKLSISTEGAQASLFYINTVGGPSFGISGAINKFGQISEQFIPLNSVFPWDSKQFRFLGTPIDGIQFEEDQIILIEFKSGNSDLTTKQRKIRNLVQNGKVDFQVIRVK